MRLWKKWLESAVRDCHSETNDFTLIESTMEFRASSLPGVFIVSAKPYTDQRGLFLRTYDSNAFSASGLHANWPQCNTSWNKRRGTLRGMHFQASACHEPKLVRCTRGRIFDVIIDLRPDSSTFCKWLAVELSYDNRDAVFIPGGCAHGFLTLEDDCEIFYMMGEIYDPTLAQGVRWNDVAFNITWPFDPVSISERDATWPDFLP